MRVLLAVCLALVCGEAMGSINVLLVSRGAESRTTIGSSVIDDSHYDSSLTPGVGGFYSLLSGSRSQTDATATAEASASLATYFGAGLSTDNLLDITGHTFADTSGSFPGALRSESNSFFIIEFEIDSLTTIDLSLSGGEIIIVKGAGRSDFYAASGDIADSVELGSDWYRALIQWDSFHENGDLPGGSNVPFSATLGFDGGLVFGEQPQFVPEASSIAAWSILALMGLALPQVGRLRRRPLHP